MNHLSEHSIELYVLKRSIFDAATRSSMEEHLKTCAVCRGVERELRTYHDEFRNTLSSASDRVREFAEKVAEQPNVIWLYPHRYLPNPDLMDDRYITVLAAHSPEAFPYRFKPIAVYSSVDQKIVVRILQDTEADVYKLYVLGSLQERCSFAVVSFPELQMDLGTDESGKKDFSLPADRCPADWHLLHAFVRLSAQ